MRAAALDQEPSVPVRPTASPGGQDTHIPGLDSIRFWCALWVYLSHSAWPLPASVTLPRLAIGIYDNLFCGVGAVIAFFVISGFCIHYPFATGVRPSPLPFLARRYIRIGGPLVVALAGGWLLGQHLVDFYEAIIWSLVAELIYYTIYPVIRPALVGRPNETLAVSYGLAAVVMATRPHAMNFHEFGPALTWIVGLPSWLLGCRLATLVTSDRTTRASAPWMWRLTVWVCSSLASVLRFHAGVGYPPTLTVFGILVFFWIREEIRHSRHVHPPPFAEFAGRWSYSIYLVHGLAALAFARAVLIPQAQIQWLAQTAFVFAASYLFSLAVERPSHVLARRTARLL